ncbi:MAG: hypothetical protein P8Z33_12440, partial [Gammaproteobacteria bacterium]
QQRVSNRTSRCGIEQMLLSISRTVRHNNPDIEKTISTYCLIREVGTERDSTYVNTYGNYASRGPLWANYRADKQA